MVDKVAVLAEVCRALSQEGSAAARDELRRRGYQFAPESITRRQYGPVESTRVFVRDGFIDRYTGGRLIFPPVLRVLSLAMPVAFPFHTNRKTDVTPGVLGGQCDG